MAKRNDRIELAKQQLQYGTSTRLDPPPTAAAEPSAPTAQVDQQSEQERADALFDDFQTTRSRRLESDLAAMDAKEADRNARIAGPPAPRRVEPAETAPSEAAPSETAPPEGRPERQSYLGRDLATGHLVGRQTFMGKPLTPQLHRIPESMRRRAEVIGSASGGASAYDPQFGGPPTPEQIASVRAEMKQKANAAAAERDLEDIRSGVMNSAGALIQAAIRGDQVAAQWAPRVQEQIADVTELEQGIAEARISGDETTATELKEERDDLIESIGNLLNTGAIPARIKAAQNQPSEEAQQRGLELAANMQQARLQAEDRRDNIRVEVQADLQRAAITIDKGLQDELGRIQNMQAAEVLQINDPEIAAIKKQLVAEGVDDNLQVASQIQAHLRRKAEAQAREAQDRARRYAARQAEIEQERLDFDVVQGVERAILNTQNDEILQPYMQQLWGDEAIAEIGYQNALKVTRDQIREQRGLRTELAKRTRFDRGDGVELTQGDLWYVVSKIPHFGQMDLSSESFEKDFRREVDHLNYLAADPSTSDAIRSQAAQTLRQMDSMKIPEIHQHSPERQILPSMKEIQS